MNIETDAEPPGPTRGVTFALRVMQLGALAVVPASSLFRTFELDRFLVPKELVLHVTAAMAVVALFGRLRRATWSRVELLLFGYLGISAVSAVLATNGWLGLRGLAISVSSVAIFLSARELREAGLARPLVHAVALAVVLAGAISLAETYGLRLDLFATSRVPGGALGNRNFVAHAAAFGLAAVLLFALDSRRRRGFLLGAGGVAILCAILVLTRSRAAFLAAAAALLMVALAMIASRALRSDAAVWRRLAGVVLIAAAGIAAALLLPNTLRWRSENPYLETVRGVANYDEGSGHGRLVQYSRSLRIAVRHPVAGVGPGNWAVAYPAEIEARRDPSLDHAESGMTANPWPSSDWIAAIVERGAAATLFLLLVFGRLAWSAWRQLRAAVTRDQALAAMTLLATLIAAAVAGTFDAVLLLPLPSLLVWSVLGALHARDELHVAAPRPALQTAVAVLLLMICAAGAVRSGAQLVAMNLYAGGRADLERAAVVDPGNYRVRMRLARMAKKERCEHALAAHALYPAADAARALSRGCD